ncbi:MAG TPA: glutaredoxin family protein [Herpetosiphonaceae bacterium]
MMFYTKPGCHLCEDVAEELEILSEQWPLQITAVDITTDLEIHRRYWDKIPVVVVGERMLAAPIVPEALRALVASSAQQMR